jgi:hypothetical protein
MTFIDDIRQDVIHTGISSAVARRDTPVIFDWLLTAFSFQGVSDQAARTYMERNGTASWIAMKLGLQQAPGCHRLARHGDYQGCRYDKGSHTCAEPEHIDECSVPQAKLRNGRLNQTAYSFYLFVRDVAGGDLVGWIDQQLATVASTGGLPTSTLALQNALIEPLRSVYGVSDKILTMTLSGLLIGAAENRPLWFEAGCGMIAVDTLVHNFLHRTGVLEGCGRPHGYGVGCYASGGCAELLRAIAGLLDARSFNANYPRDFPRFVQHAIWRYCSIDGLNICTAIRLMTKKAAKTPTVI